MNWRLSRHLTIWLPHYRIGDFKLICDLSYLYHLRYLQCLQAVHLKQNPIYLMFPTAIATSFAFMLPVATPPNAVVFSYGYVRVVDMVSICFYLYELNSALKQLILNIFYFQRGIPYNLQIRRSKHK